VGRILDDCFKPLFRVLDYEWDAEDSLYLLERLKINFSYPVELVNAKIAVTSDYEYIVIGLFEFNQSKIYFGTKQSKHFVLDFLPDIVYYITDLADIVPYSRIGMIKK